MLQLIWGWKQNSTDWTNGTRRGVPEGVPRHSKGSHVSFSEKTENSTGSLAIPPPQKPKKAFAE